MSQILHLGDNKFLTVDQVYADGGEAAQYAMQGGKRVVLSIGERPVPMIFRIGREFFYSDGKPVTELEHTRNIPEPYKTWAVDFVTKKAPEVKSAPIVATKEAAQKRGRGRPKKAQPKMIEIKDEASYRAAGGA